MVAEHEGLTKEQGAYVDQYFMDNVYPVLTPMAVDSSRPFPLIRNKIFEYRCPDHQERGRGRKRAGDGFCHCAGAFCSAKSGGSSGRKGRRKQGSSLWRRLLSSNIGRAVSQLQCGLCPSLPDYAECGFKH